MKLLYDVQFVPGLAHNLLNVGQLMNIGYSIMFNGGSCVIHDKKTDQSIVSIPITQNIMFPFDVSNVVKNAFVSRGVLKLICGIYVMGI